MRVSNLFLDFNSARGSYVEQTGQAAQIAAGHYAILPIGTKILKNVEGIIHREMEDAGAVEVVLPMVQPKDLWEQSQRWDVYGQEMFKFQNRKGADFCLGPTHEEVATEVVRRGISSAKGLPLNIYQVTTKFRDERRPRGGMLRAKEFLMKDAYSFDKDEAGLRVSYEVMREAYQRIFNEVGVPFLIVNADAGEVGGNSSEEFIVRSDAGEDKFVMGDKGAFVPATDEPESEIIRGIEVGHIFALGTRYSSLMGLEFANAENVQVPVEMGCYGIGVSRLLQTVLDHSFDGKRLNLPSSINPFKVGIIPTRHDDQDLVDVSERLYQDFRAEVGDTVIDDRTLPFGRKIKDAGLMGVEQVVIVGKGVKNGEVDVEDAAGNKATYSIDRVVEAVGETL